MGTSQRVIDKLKKQLEPKVVFEAPYSTRINYMTYGLFGSKDAGYGKRVTAVMRLIESKLSVIKNEGGCITLNSYALREELHYFRTALPYICFAMLMEMKTSDTIEVGAKHERIRIDYFLQIKYERQGKDDVLIGTRGGKGTTTTRSGGGKTKDGGKGTTTTGSGDGKTKDGGKGTTTTRSGGGKTKDGGKGATTTGSGDGKTKDGGKGTTGTKAGDGKTKDGGKGKTTTGSGGGKTKDGGKGATTTRSGGTKTDKNAAYYNKTGDQYLEGNGVPKDEKKAYECYKKAAEMNDAEGLYNLAWCLQNGVGITKSVPKAKNYYLKSAEMGFAKAMAKYAFILFFGVKDDNDPALKESFEYMKKAADAGNADAQAHIAQAYQEDGWGAPEINWDLAKEYLMKAVEQGNEHAMWILAENYQNGSFGWPEDHEASHEYYRKAAEAGSVKAMVSYTGLLFFGDYKLERSFDQAYQWAEKAYENGGDVRPWYGALTVRKACTGRFSKTVYNKGLKLLQQSIDEDGDRRAAIFLHRLNVLEKYEKPCSEGRIDNMIYLAFIQTDLCLGSDADDKEILAEIEYPNAFRDALSGDCYACAALSSLFVNNKMNDKRGPYPLTNLLDLELGEKWARKAYETKNVDGIEVYLRMLGIVAYTSFKVGGFEVSVKKIDQMRKVIKEINAVKGYSGHFSQPDVAAGYYLTQADALYELHEFDRAVKVYKECIKLHETPDANFGVAACLFIQEDNTYFRWLEKALSMDNWYAMENQSAAYYFAACVYRDGIGVDADINTSYEWMKRAADLNHEAAQQELSRYQKVRGGYRYQ